MGLSETAATMRCADADRELVTHVLATAYAEGRITTDEHAERLDAAWRARTFGELEALTADLNAPPVPAPLAGAAAVAGQPLVTGENAGIDRIDAVLGSVRRQGAWTLRRHTVGRVVLGDAKLDLRQCRFESDECFLDLRVRLGDVKILVGPGVAVRDEMRVALGDRKLVGLRPGGPGSPTLVLRGSLVLGDLKVLGPDQPGFAQLLGLTR